MKKTNFQRIISLILALVMLVGMVSINTFAADSETEATVVPTVSKNIYFGEKIHLMFALPAADVEGAEIAINITDGENTYAVVEMEPDTDNNLGKDLVAYRSKAGVAAQDIDKVFNVAVAIDGQEIANFTYSVLEYLYARLLTANNVSAEQRAMYENLIAYADSADKVINKDAAGIADKYVYVTTANCTFDGGKTAGIVAKDSVIADFDTDLVATLTHDLQYKIEALASEASDTKTAEEMVDGYIAAEHVKVTAQLVENGYVEPAPVEPTITTTTYDFSKYPAGVQYAEENHDLDDNVVLSISDCHLTSELRIYSSTTNNGVVIVKSLLPVTAIAVNAGNKVDILNVYGSNDDGATWDEVATIAVAATAYADYTADLGGDYKWIKFDVEGTNQVRLKTLTLTTSTTCAHENNSTTTLDPTCEETGYILTTCNDCGYVIREVGEAATGHDYDEEITTPVTCTTPGVKTYTCHCGDTKTESILPEGHSVETGTCPDCGENVGGSSAPVVVLLATFTMGTNGSASHADGSSKTSYSETVNGYTLNITNGAQMYTGARDAKGNACLKFGSSSNIGSMKFIVPDNVTEVVIYVAQYKANTTKVTINGTTTTLTKASNNGEYDAITIDTTSTKTVTFTTVSGANRAMLNTIEFHGYAQ